MSDIRLKIKNFKCFSDNLISINGLTVFAGGNGAGKSSAIQSILYLRRTIEHCGTWDPTKKVYSYSQINGLNVELNGPYCLNLGNSEYVLSADALNSNILLGFVNTSGESFEVEYSFDSGKELWLTPKSVTGNILNNPLFFQEFYYLNAERLGPRLNQESHFYDYPNVGYHGEFTAQIINSCNFDKFDAKRAYNPELKGARLEHYINSWLQYILDGVSITPFYDEAVNVARVEFSHKFSKRSSVVPTNTGFGLSYLLPIIVSGVIAREGRFLIVENPEAHLHPAAQSRIGFFLAHMAACGLRVIVETHSDHVLNGIQLAIASKVLPGSMATINFFSHNVSGTDINEIEISDKGELSNWPKGFFDQTQADFARLYTLRRNGQ